MTSETRWNAKDFLRTRLMRHREPGVNLWQIHPDIEVALFAINPVTRKPFLGGTRPPAESPAGACNPSALGGETSEVSQ